LLSARKSSKLKPDFVIFDPYLTRKRKDTKNAKTAKNKMAMTKKKNVDTDDGEKVKKTVKNVKTRAAKKQKESSQISHHLLENEEEEEDVDVENGKRTNV
jgi:hypothetical protein